MYILSSLTNRYIGSFLITLFQTQEDLKGLRNILAEDRKTKKYQNIATVIFKNDANVDEEELVKALDKKYDALLDKLALDALKKQLGKYISKNIPTIWYYSKSASFWCIIHFEQSLQILFVNVIVEI